MPARSSGCVIGVDIGGTKMAAASVDAAGQIGQVQVVATAPERGPDDGLRRIAELIAGAVSPNAGVLRGIGIGCSGPLDTERGVVRNPFTLPTWDGLELMAPLQARFGVPVALLNDCDAAALGEAWRGAGQALARVVYVAIGTGIGAGIVIDGQLLEAPGGVAGEIGHATIEINGPPCYCGSTGCLEMLASGPAIERSVRAAGGPDWDALQQIAGSDQPVTAEVIVAGARAGIQLARVELASAARALGAGLANLGVTIAPERIIVGGGLSKAWDLLGPEVIATFAQRTRIIEQVRTQIVLSTLPNAAIVGAARHVWSRFDAKRHQ